MSTRRVKPDEMDTAIMDILEEYKDASVEDMKKAIKSSGDSIKKDISATAPRDTGKYAKSWAVKKVKETSDGLEIVVHSRNRYQIAHLLEHGHAKRGGGRWEPSGPHIKPAEERGVEKLEQEIKKALKG